MNLPNQDDQLQHSAGSAGHINRELTTTEPGLIVSVDHALKQLGRIHELDDPAALPPTGRHSRPLRHLLRVRVPALRR
jgi:hypothetical protein